MKKIGFAVLVSSCLLLSSCSQLHYSKTRTGEIKGRLIVEWMAPDRFLYIPDPSQPLTFTRSDKTAITPQRMITDGGSIPRPLWALRNYSPWGYGPAFIVHDWLFVMQDCQLPGFEDWTVDEAAHVMSEVMKTLMEKPGFDYGDEATIYRMYLAVQSPPARQAWEDRNCQSPPSPTADGWRADAKFVIEF